jgi:hypothetical protein
MLIQKFFQNRNAWKSKYARAKLSESKYQKGIGCLQDDRICGKPVSCPTNGSSPTKSCPITIYIWFRVPSINKLVVQNHVPQI